MNQIETNKDTEFLLPGIRSTRGDLQTCSRNFHKIAIRYVHVLRHNFGNSWEHLKMNLGHVVGRVSTISLEYLSYDALPT
jgi:hypothetical protein